MDEELKQNLTAAETWLRGLFILMVVFFLVVARVVTSAVVVIQFLFTVFSGQTNDNLCRFGSSLSQYIFQALLFITYNSDTKPFPFNPWPEPKSKAPSKTDSSQSVDTESDEDSRAESPDRELDTDEPDEHEPQT